MFGSRVGGAAEFTAAQNATLNDETAFVFQLSEQADRNKLDSGVIQKVNENFGVVVALKNDTTPKDELGLTAHDKLFTARKELWSALLGWEMRGAQDDNIESQVSYVGGRLLGIDRGYLWYLFTFTVSSRIDSTDDGVGDDVVYQTGLTELPELHDIFTQTALVPGDVIPGGDLPSSLLPPTLDQLITADRAFSEGFSSGFDTLAALANK
jgi:hypothetical protein